MFEVWSLELTWHAAVTVTLKLCPTPTATVHTCVRISGFGFRVSGFGFGVSILGLSVQGSGWATPTDVVNSRPDVGFGVKG